MARSKSPFQTVCRRLWKLLGCCVIVLSVASARGLADFGGFSPPLLISSGSGPTEVVAGDLDGDGDLDFAAVNYWDHSIRIIKRHANGSFVLAGLYTTGNYPQSISMGDFDADGDLDLAVVGEYNSDFAFVHSNNGNGHFSSVETFPVGGSPRSVTAADVNGDGVPDLVVANRMPSTVSILISNGAAGSGASGAFQAQVVYALGGAPSKIITEDLDGDGALDIAVACWGSNDVRILTNHGAGTFSGPMIVPTDLMPYGVAAGDFDGDGRVDLATANFSNGTVSVLMGRPATRVSKVAFASAVHLPVQSYNLRAIAVDDFDLDGNDDIVVAHGWSTVHTFLGVGDGSFLPPLSHAAGSQPRGIASADVDGDGDADLVVANFGNSKIGVLTNLTTIR
ncbi:MAG TPA: VCBS repeat-containing protein [Planctomycetota bacterium]|nr:VCBS repeat-containing protein [Planctomycetota bacterium]